MWHLALHATSGWPPFLWRPIWLHRVLLNSSVSCFNKKMLWTPPACPFRRVLAWHYAMATMHAKRIWWRRAESPHRASVVGNAGLRAFSPSVLWPSSDVLDLFDHAVSKSERNAVEEAERHVADDDADSST